MTDYYKKFRKTRSGIDVGTACERPGTKATSTNASVGIDCSSAGGRRSLTPTSPGACRVAAPRDVPHAHTCTHVHIECVDIEIGRTTTRSKRQPIVPFHLSRLIAGRKIIIDVTLEERGNEEGVDSTCSESSLSGRAKGMGDRNDLTKGREEWWTTKMVVRAWRREKNLANGMKQEGERDEWFTLGW
ncbi:hypothetical protein G5I_03061 [Acromyrmex echinatior]|uniref:Uncharacterized protein n=1 Tax=Acromyrmex echinatior TaxID=103372 RepID=F4WBZ0_ACREC|nr:hypothetical protein G5I_03061 [Acromyrmex echinatior]